MTAGPRPCSRPRRRRRRRRARGARSRRRAFARRAAGIAAGVRAGRAVGAPGAPAKPGQAAVHVRGAARGEDASDPAAQDLGTLVAQRMPGIQDGLRSFQLAWLIARGRVAAGRAARGGGRPALPDASRRFAAHTLAAEEARAPSARGGAAGVVLIRLVGAVLRPHHHPDPGKARPSDLQQVMFASGHAAGGAARRTRRCELSGASRPRLLIAPTPWSATAGGRPSRRAGHRPTDRQRAAFGDGRRDAGRRGRTHRIRRR